MTGSSSGTGIVVLDLVVVGAVLYIVGVSRLRRRGVRWPVRRSAAAGCGLASIVVAAEFLPDGFPGHVARHLLVAMLGPLFLALSAPVTLALRSLPRRGRRALLAVLHHRLAAFATIPAVVVILELGGLYAFYLTPLFGAAQQHPLLGAVIHVHMFLAGCLLSWSVLGRDPLPHRPSLRTALTVLLIAAVGHDIVAKVLYAEGIPGQSGAVDELRSGAQLMYYGGSVAEVLLALGLMTGWYRRSGRELRRTARRASRHVGKGAAAESPSAAEAPS